MKCKKFALQVLLFSLAFFYFACTNAIEDINSSGENTEVSRSVSTSSASISDFYWGYWIRLDTGDSYFISDSAIYCEGVLFSKNASSLSKYGDDSFAKMTISDSSAVLVRKYKQIAPFSLEVRSLQSGEILNQVEIVRTNEEIPSDSETAIKDSDGAFCFKTAISACKQKLNLTYTNNSGKKTEFSLNVVSPIYESKLGVIYISEDSELPSLKLISDFDLEAEPFYANDFQSYKAKFSILNFGADVDSAFSWEINSTDFLLHLEGDSSGTFSSIKQGDSIELDLSISYGFLEKEFVDVPISLTIYSQSENNLKWSDSVTVRFYRAPVYFMVNAETFASETALYGTLTAPSGFTSHFYIPSYSKNSTQVLAPWNNSGNSYILALCSSGNSGRFYSFVAGDTELSANYLEDWQSFFQNAIDELLEKYKNSYEQGFGNDSPSSSANILFGTEVCRSYISEGDLDFFAVNASDVFSSQAKVPLITVQPSSVYVQNGESAYVRVSALSLDGGNLTYQWYTTDNPATEGSLIAGAEDSSYTAIPDEKTWYFCRVTNTLPGGKASEAKSVTSRPARILASSIEENVSMSEAPFIYAQPLVPKGNIYLGDTVTFTVGAKSSSNAKLQYQWYVSDSAAESGKVIAGETKSELSVLANKIGTSYYYCTVSSDSYGKTNTVQSDRVIFSVQAQNAKEPVIVRNPLSISATVGKEVTLRVEVEPPTAGTILYQWFCSESTVQSGKLIEGAQDSSYTHNLFENEDLYFYCEITN